MPPPVHSDGSVPDLSVYSIGKHSGLDYIFALLLAYRDPHAGILVSDGLCYNPYCPGGLIAMPPPLRSDGLVPDPSGYSVGKHNGFDYIFALPLAYRDPHAGIPVRDGLYYNPYYPGGFIDGPPLLHFERRSPAGALVWVRHTGAPWQSR